MLDTLMMRALDGEDTITVRDDGTTRKRAPNYRLGLSLLDRVNPEEAEQSVKMIIADFDSFLDVLAKGSQYDDLEEFFTQRIRNKMQLEKILSTLPLPQETRTFVPPIEVKAAAWPAPFGFDPQFDVPMVSPANDVGDFGAELIDHGG